MNKKYKLIQKVPKTPKSAYNHGRFVSALIKNQLEHFNEVEKSVLKPGEKLTDVSKIKTELQASKYLKQMTARLHPQGADKPPKAVSPRKAKRASKPAKRKQKTKSKSGKRKKR